MSRADRKARRVWLREHYFTRDAMSLDTPRMTDLLTRLRAKNFFTCWHDREHWPAVNRHLWRISAMYGHGDCFLAGFPGAQPHDRLSTEHAWRAR